MDEFKGFNLVQLKGLRDYFSNLIKNCKYESMIDTYTIKLKWVNLLIELKENDQLKH